MESLTITFMPGRTREEVIARVIIERPTATQMFVPAIIRVLARD
jgi:hypothetical protein